MLIFSKAYKKPLRQCLSKVMEFMCLKKHDISLMELSDSNEISIINKGIVTYKESVFIVDTSKNLFIK